MATIRRYNKVIFSCVLVTLFSGCISPLEGQYSNTTAEIKQTLDQSIKENKKLPLAQVKIPGTVFSALAPKVNFAKQQEEPHFDISAQNQDAKQFFSGLAKGAGVSMMVSPNISGDITLDMKDVTLGEVLNAIRAMYGFEFVKAPYGYDVLAAEIDTRIFTLNKVNITRSGSSEMSIETEGTDGDNGSSSSGLSTSSEDNFWDNLEKTINLIIESDTEADSQVVVNPSSGIIVVRAYPSELRKVAAFLDATQGITKRQVIIEAKVLEITLSDKFGSGINWNVDGFDIVQTTANGIAGLPPSITGSYFADQVTGTFTRHDSFSAIINMLSSQGKISVISSPRIATMNNQKAIIKIGSDEYYATNISSDTTTSNATTTSSSVGLEPFFSGVALDVTPQIDSNKNIMLHIHPVISHVMQDEKSFTVQDGVISLPMAKSTIRESDSIVYARSGQVVVIGGLMQRSISKDRSKKPVPAELQYAADAIAAKSDVLERSEVVILLRPVVVDQRNIEDSLRGTMNRIEKLS